MESCAYSIYAGRSQIDSSRNDTKILHFLPSIFIETISETITNADFVHVHILAGFVYIYIHSQRNARYVHIYISYLSVRMLSLILELFQIAPSHLYCSTVYFVYGYHYWWFFSTINCQSLVENHYTCVHLVRQHYYHCIVLFLAITGICFAANIIMLATGIKFDHIAITILTIIATMINDSAFWMSIVQITTQRYPTVVRCIAFGSLHSIK